MDPFDVVLKDLQTLYTQLTRKLTDPNAPDNPLSRKSISQLSNKLYPLIDSSSSSKQSDQNKHILLQVFSSHVTNFLNNQLVDSLIRCQEEMTFAKILTQGWEQFKRFVFTYHALLIHAKDYYEKESVNAKMKNQGSKENSTEFAVLPVAAFALKIFNTAVLTRFQNKMERITLKLLEMQREKQQPQDDKLRILLQLYWSCCLKELGRISMNKGGVITFSKQKNKQVTLMFKESDKNQERFKSRILSTLVHNSCSHYNKLYWDNIQPLHASEQIHYLLTLCRRSQSLSEFHFPSQASRKYYLSQIHMALLADLQNILTKPKGFKYILINCGEHTQEMFEEAMVYFQVFRRVEEQALPVICKMVGQAISQKGQEINSKIGKARQHIPLMLQFKKAVRKIFDSAQTHSLQIEQTMQKQFKKLLQSLQSSKNLAEYADFTAKECVRLKLDDDNCQTRFRDIIFLLSSLSAKDSFLLHYQQYLCRRLLDSVNEPRTDIENIGLKLLGQHLGILTVAHHVNMVKDIEKSIDTSSQLHDRLPFISYKWDLRVFNPAMWPESASKQKHSHIESPSLIKSHSSILEQLYQQHYGVQLKLRLERGTSLFQGKFGNLKVKFQGQNSYLFLLLHLTDQPSGKATFNKLRTLFADKKEHSKTSPLQHLIQVLVETRLVTRQGEQGPLDPQEVVSLNCSYKPPQGSKPQVPVMIRPSPALMKSLNQVNIDQNRILKEREKLIDAMLVKNLKHANATKGNSITFAQLYEGVCSNNFLQSLQIPQSLVKQRLQYLIVKQFCRRDEQDRKIYHYIA